MHVYTTRPYPPGSLPPFCRAGGGAPGPGTHAQRQQQFVYAPWDARTYARDPENTIGVVMRVSKLLSLIFFIIFDYSSR
jgi:hypothetical protein